MIASVDVALVYIARLLAVSVILQSIEFLKTPDAEAFYPWKFARSHLPGPLAGLVSPVMKNGYLRWLFVSELLFAVALFVMPNPIASIGLVVILWLSSLRWSGAYNGGSDYMTFLIAFAIAVAEAFPKMKGIMIGFVAVQLIFSYWISGLKKLKSQRWRRGRALVEILNSPIYGLPQFMKSARKSAHHFICELGDHPF